MAGLWTTMVMTLAMAVTNVGGTTLLRFSTESNKQAYFWVGSAAYVIGAAIYMELLKENSLAVVAVASSTLQLGLMISLSIWLFDERVNFVQGTAMAVALAGASIAMLAATH